MKLKLSRVVATLSAPAMAALLVPTGASAHVSVHPNAVPAGANATLDIRVPNEMDNAKTTRLQVQFPAGFIGVSTQPPPGWTSKVLTSKLAKPVQTDDGPIDTQVSEVDWTAGAGAGIPAGQFANFPISVALPGRPGQTLTFKTVQTYSNGKVTRWIGAPDSDQPAPTIDVTAKGGVLQDVAGGEAGPGALPAATAGAQTATPVATRTVVEKQSANNTLSVIALIVGLLGLAAGATGLVVARRARRGERTAVRSSAA
jgi:periplasmic copper chaperone A